MRGENSVLTKVWSFLLVSCVAVPVPAAADTASKHEVEIYRYDVAPKVVLGKRSMPVGGVPFGDLGVDAYLVVVRLDPGDRFISARAEARDGFFCIPRSGRGAGLAGRIAARLGYQVALQSAPSEIAKTLGLVADLVPLNPSSKLPPPRLKRRMVLKAKDVEHHEGYVAALLLVASNPLTRLHIDRVVTKANEPRGKRHRREARTVALPDKSQAGMPRERIMSILSGEEDRNPRPHF